MKKVFLVVLMFMIIGLPTFAASKSRSLSSSEVRRATQKIDEIGFSILNANNITKRMVFDFSTRNIKNAVTYSNTREIIIYKGMYNKLQSDDELAAVLAHEISHAIDSYNGAASWSYVFQPRKYEYKADKRAVDFMVNAGYNPVAMIIIMNKCFGQERYDWGSSHPTATRRMMEVYEYIYKKYPEFLAKNVYKNDIYYQNFLLTSQENRAKLQAKLESQSKQKVDYK